MKIDRLVAIIMLLLDREVVTTSELAERLEVSRRTIFRDVDTLTMAGLPIFTTRGSDGGVSLMKSYKVDKKLFTPKDVRSLITSLESYNQLLEKNEIANTLAKVQSMESETDLIQQWKNDGHFSVDLTLNQGNRFLRDRLKLIETAMEDHRYLVFQYIDKNGEDTSRKVEPYKVIFKESSWYLQAFCVKRKDYRTFKIARMNDVSMSVESFSPKEFVSLPMDGSNWMTKETVPVIIKIDKSIKDKIIERFGEDYVISQHKNGYIAKYPIVDNEHGYNALLQFGDKCEIIEP